VLQEKEIRRVGGSENITIDVRVITATNKNLVKMCQEGTFREDLYHRLKKFYLKIPSLKARTEDIDPLVKHFLKKHGREKLAISEEVMEILRMNRWNGNVRELENVIEYFIAVSEDHIVRITDLPEDFFEYPVRHQTEFESCSERLCNMGNLEEYVYLLNMIKTYNDKGVTISRRTLTEIAKEKYTYVTEDRIRRKTDDLQELRLITKSVGRIGMRLTLNGVKYINNYLQFPPINS
jgi:transcriptional regulator with PAS, ATPase and Fis domain